MAAHAWPRPAALATLAVLAGCASHPRFAGPLPVRDQHPAQLTVLHIGPGTAQPLPAGAARVRLGAAYSSLFLSGEGGGNAFEMDGELLRTGLATRVGLGRGFDLHLELALAHTSGGFLDGFLTDYHRLLGFPDQGRSQVPRNRFSVGARRGSETVLDMSPEALTLLDLPVGLSWAFVPVTEEHPWGLAARTAVELPTGNQKHGYGSGELEYAFGLQGEWRCRHAAVTAHVQYTFAGTPAPARRGGLRYRDVAAAGLGVELPLTDGLSALLQTEVESSTLRGLGFSRVSDNQWLLWAGARAKLAPQVALELALGEDLSAFVAPDVTAYAALVVAFGATGG